MPADPERFPFLFGAQYYRAPTPEPECWETDLQAIRRLGFNAVKFFVQWRWSHRSPDRFYFDDLDRLMDLAQTNRLGVTLNFILDVAPVWLYAAYPDARQVDLHGQAVEPYVVGHRQVGGHPGPCYNHPGALAARQRFVSTSIEHFKKHPALQMWDVWNEPELCFPQRTPNLTNLVCYCSHCRAQFLAWLKHKYGDLSHLNTVWGRPYEDWEQVELPRGTGTFTDFIDWREFHLDTLAQEAAWRLDTVKCLDPAHGRYLHVVPNLWFSAVTCADDFAMAENCEVFAATMNGQPTMFQHVLSAGNGKVCYNVESHLNFGSTGLHARVLGMSELLADFLPQIGAGIKGFLFWQYRAETFGMEAPAWGLVRADGSPRPITAAVQKFWATLQPYAAELRQAFPEPARVGVWRSRKNEIFHFCMQGQVNDFNAAIEAYIQALYWNNLPQRLINSSQLAAGQLADIKLLIMANGYYVTQEEAQALNEWIQAGGVLLCEAHLAGYNATRGRHNQTVPGCGLAEAWKFCEVESTAPVHLRFSEEQLNEAGLPDDVRKALAEARKSGAAGGEYYPIQMMNGALVWGAYRYAELAGESLQPLGSFGNHPPCLGRQKAGKGAIYYCGTNFGQAFKRDPAGLQAVLQQAAQEAGIQPTAGLSAQQPAAVHLDLLSHSGRPCFMALVNRSNEPQAIQIQGQGRWHGLFSQAEWVLGDKDHKVTRLVIPGNFSELFHREG